MVEAAGREVVVYTQPGCPCCAREKRFLETKVAAGNPPVPRSAGKFDR